MAAQRPPIRIAFCHHSSDVGGGSDRCLFELATHLPRDRFHSLVILKTGDPLAADYRAAGIEVAEVPLVHPRKTRDLGVQARFLASYGPSVLRVAAAIRRFGADLVHVNTMNNVQGPLAARLAGRPLVWHIREINSDSKAGHALASMVRALATRVVAISKPVAETVKSSGDRVRVIHDGINLDAYDDLPLRADARRRIKLPIEPPIVLCIGRLEPWKGQHVFIEAAAEVLSHHPDARFLIVGAPAVNKPDYLPKLQSRCAELGISHSVTFTGARKEVPLYLAACDVLVLPSVSPEPFGLTVVEAMAAARPVVATAAGGPLETVADGETGLLVPPDDPHAMAKAISDLLADPRRANSMGDQGRHRAYDHFTLERHVRDMAELFESVYAENERCARSTLR